MDNSWRRTKMSLPSVVRQWSSNQDGIENLTLGECPMPEPGVGEVLVRISTIAINYRVG